MGAAFRAAVDFRDQVEEFEKKLTWATRPRPLGLAGVALCTILVQLVAGCCIRPGFRNLRRLLP